VTHGPRVMLVTWPATRGRLHCGRPIQHGASGGFLIPACSAPGLADSPSLRAGPEALSGHRRARGSFLRPHGVPPEKTTEPPKRARRTPSSARQVSPAPLSSRARVILSARRPRNEKSRDDPGSC